MEQSHPPVSHHLDGPHWRKWSSNQRKLLVPQEVDPDQRSLLKVQQTSLMGGTKFVAFCFCSMKFVCDNQWGCISCTQSKLLCRPKVQSLTQLRALRSCPLLPPESYTALQLGIRVQISVQMDLIGLRSTRKWKCGVNFIRTKEETSVGGGARETLLSHPVIHLELYLWPACTKALYSLFGLFLSANALLLACF